MTSSRWWVEHGDAIESMAMLPDQSVDAVVMDPPYCAGAVAEASRTAAKGQGLRSETLTRFGWFTGDNMGTAGLVFLLRAIAFQAMAVVKPSGHLLCFCDWRMLPNIAPGIESAGWRYQGLVVWDKGHMGLGNGFRAQHELVLHYTAGAPTYHDRATSNVIQSKRVHHTEREHQTQKPVDLLQRLIRVVVPKGGTVLDPFAGSGSTGIAALAEGCHFIGIEREAEYVEIARRRLKHVDRRND